MAVFRMSIWDLIIIAFLVSEGGGVAGHSNRTLRCERSYSFIVANYLFDYISTIALLNKLQ